MKITIYELLGKVKDDKDTDIYVKYVNRIKQKEDKMLACKENIIYKLDQLVIGLNDEVEIIEDKPEHIEELKIEQDGATYYIKNEFGTKCYLTKHSKIIADKVNELSKAVNYLLDKDKQ